MDGILGSVIGLSRHQFRRFCGLFPRQFWPLDSVQLLIGLALVIWGMAHLDDSVFVLIVGLVSIGSGLYFIGFNRGVDGHDENGEREEPDVIRERMHAVLSSMIRIFKMTAM